MNLDRSTGEHGRTARRTLYGQIAIRISAELRALGLAGSPAPAQPISAAFGAPELEFARWLEHVLCPRLIEISAGHSEPPTHSRVATRAAREFDGVEGTGPLLDTLRELDSLTSAQT
jgi:uncharacterized protein YqcC (DUF446 family)